jgi:hypothetical protein
MLSVRDEPWALGDFGGLDDEFHPEIFIMLKLLDNFG